MNIKRKLVRGFWILLGAALLGWWVYTSPAREARAFLSDFNQAPTLDKRAVFSSYYDSLGPAGILDALEQEFPLCHGQAHDLGKVVYERSQDLNGSIVTCRDRCSSGCFHGVLMEAFQDVAVEEPNDEHPPGEEDVHVRLEDLRAKIEQTCSLDEVTSVHPPGRCAHGLGHALMFLAEYDIPTALEYCGLFSDRRMEYYCNGGAFMEYDLIWGRQDFTNGKALHYPCDTYTEFPAACYFYRMSYLLRIRGGVDKVAQECLTLPRYSRLGCLRGLGLSQITALNQTPGQLAKVCSAGDTDDQKACIEGAVERWSDFDTPAPRVACQSLTGDELKQWCEAAADRGGFKLDKSFDLIFDPTEPAAGS